MKFGSISILLIIHSVSAHASSLKVAKHYPSPTVLEEYHPNVDDFPDVEYPQSTLESAPFFFKGQGVLDPFSEDVKTTFKTIVDESKKTKTEHKFKNASNYNYSQVIADNSNKKDSVVSSMLNLDTLNDKQENKGMPVCNELSITSDNDSITINKPYSHTEQMSVIDIMRNNTDVEIEHMTEEDNVALIESTDTKEKKTSPSDVEDPTLTMGMEPGTEYGTKNEEIKLDLSSKRIEDESQYQEENIITHFDDTSYGFAENSVVVPTANISESTNESEVITNSSSDNVSDKLPTEFAEEMFQNFSSIMLDNQEENPISNFDDTSDILPQVLSQSLSESVSEKPPTKVIDNDSLKIKNRTSSDELIQNDSITPDSEYKRQEENSTCHFNDTCDILSEKASEVASISTQELKDQTQSSIENVLERPFNEIFDDDGIKIETEEDQIFTQNCEENCIFVKDHSENSTNI